ncbi:hypothetical protein MAMC_01483 [Methylacidimicrobium cyclopophantes]|uniref:DUF4337 domain-containing protein n=1 Tax=Methylacidimicrobium cyclopophantes TaxID=1041766 RepID=A0A5E6MDY1_9BACT|nr:DUF4337 family protein [Methylacidimicrobium cyclopophantes]VVM07183.1 hypothetical protein MAMC_01483 [Methylacidimicrobium cyclopophantes]
MEDETLREKTREVVADALREAERAEKWLLSLSFSIILMAVFGTIAGTAAEEEVTRMIVLRNEAVLLQDKATDAWGYFQGKSIRESLYRMANRLKPDPFFERESARYEKEKALGKQQAEGWEREVAARMAESERALHRHHLLRTASVLLQLATAVGSVAALVKRKSAWVISLVIALAGVLMFVCGSW